MARILSHQQKRSFSFHLHRSFSRQARASKGEEPAKKPKYGVLSIAERCKCILAVNWRGQLTTVKPRLVDKEERKKAGRTLGELSSYIILDGKAIVWVPEDSQHCPNLLLNNRASFIVGHTDPSPLMKAFQQVKKAPPHAILVGTLIVPGDDDDMLSAGFMKVTIKKQISELQQAVNQSTPTIRAILESGSHVLRTRVQALTSMLESKEDDTFYQFDASSCHYVDSLGEKHMVDLEASKKALNPLSPLLPVVMEGINRNYTRRLGLKLLCAWFLRVKVKDAFIFAADRWGLNVLAQIVVDPKGLEDVSKRNKIGGKKVSSSATLEWKDLRLTFKQEVEDLNEFCTMLGQMEKESLVALNQVEGNIRGRMAERELDEA